MGMARPAWPDVARNRCYEAARAACREAATGGADLPEVLCHHRHSHQAGRSQPRLTGEPWDPCDPPGGASLLERDLLRLELRVAHDVRGRARPADLDLLDPRGAEGREELRAGDRPHETDGTLTRRRRCDQTLPRLDDDRDQLPLGARGQQRAGCRPVAGDLGTQVGMQGLRDQLLVRANCLSARRSSRSCGSAPRAGIDMWAYPDARRGAIPMSGPLIAPMVVT